MEIGRTIDPKTFWHAIGVRAIGPAIVTAEDPDGPAGFLALSSAHLCADPPMMLVTIGLKTSALKAVIASAHFAINYLAEGDESLADVFGGKTQRKGAERFEADRWTKLTTGAPILKNAVGSLDCVLEESIERHDTVIAIGRLVDFISHGGRSPLISFAGRTLPLSR